jgi:hypothetical protein
MEIKGRAMKILTKQQFQEMAFPTGEGKNIVEPKMQIHPNNTGAINGNTYAIRVYEFEDKVELEKIESFDEVK